MRLHLPRSPRPIRISPNLLVLAVALSLASAGNIHFWSVFVPAVGGVSFAQLPLLAGSFAIVALVFHALLTILSFPPLVKPVLVASIFVASVSSWFIIEYGIAIDKSLVQSLFETDVREAVELLNWPLALFVAVTGGVPAWIVARVPIRPSTGLRGLARMIGISCAALLLAALLCALLFKSLAPAVREHRELRFLLTPTIDILRRAQAADKVDTAMLYFSDHGASLGENNLYLHGAPYLFAPSQQTHAPMMSWMSDGFASRFHIDRARLRARSDQPLSHDNVFHSVLGMLDIDTAIRNPRLDVFHACAHRA